MAQTYFASIQPGLEEALLDEIRRIGGNRPKVLTGGVEFDAARKRLYLAHLQLRTPTRIWLRVDEFRARDAPELYNKTRRYNWERLIGGEHRIRVEAHSKESRLYHTGKIADAVADALTDRFAEDLGDESPPEFTDDTDDDALVVMARIVDDRCQLSLDASGERLHIRGWRTEAGDAPLRESMAAAMLELVDWSPEDGLADPMCGAGTIPVEAAWRALDRPPGLDRAFAFHRWRNFQPERYQKMADELRDDVADELPAPIRGYDADGDVIERARRNAKRAHADDHVDFDTAPLSDLQLPNHIRWIVTNPPYGERLGESGIISELIKTWQNQHGRCQLAFLWPSKARDVVDGHNISRLHRTTSFDYGGISVDLWTTQRAER